MTARGVLIAALTVCACGDDGAMGLDARGAFDARVVMLGCDAEAQDCPAGEKCNPTGPALGPWEGTTCVEDNAANGSAAGSPCFLGPESTDTCDPSSLCLQLGTGEGVCTPYCTDSPADSCDADQLCVLYDDAAGVKLCSLRCDLAGDDCPLTYHCIDSLAGPACVPFAFEGEIPTR